MNEFNGSGGVGLSFALRNMHLLFL